MGGAGSDTIDGGFGSDVIDGGDGADAVFSGHQSDYTFASSEDGLTVTVTDRSTGDFDTVTNVETLSFDDGDIAVSHDGTGLVLVGQSADNIEVVGPVGVTVLGEAGDDHLMGGDGNDTIDGGEGSDNLDGGAGNDTVTFALEGGSGGIVLDLETGQATNTNGAPETILNFENVIASENNDTIHGTEERNEINSLNGDDTIYARGGDDIIQVGLGDYLIDGGDGADTVDYSSINLDAHIDVLTGLVSKSDTSSDILINIENIIGAQGDDVIIGDASNNWLSGAEGDDLIDGGDGFDTAVFHGDMDGYAIDFVLGTVTDIDATDGDFGTDTLIGVEALSFTNGDTISYPVETVLGVETLSEAIVDVPQVDVVELVGGVDEGNSYAITVNGETVSYTAQAGDTLSSVRTNLVDAINADDRFMSVVSAQNTAQAGTMLLTGVIAGMVLTTTVIATNQGIDADDGATVETVSPPEAPAHQVTVLTVDVTPNVGDHYTVTIDAMTFGHLVVEGEGIEQVRDALLLQMASLPVATAEAGAAAGEIILQGKHLGVGFQVGDTHEDTPLDTPVSHIDDINEIDEPLFNGPVDDILLGGAGDDTLTYVSGTNILDGGAGVDVASFEQLSGTPVIVDLSNSQFVIDGNVSQIIDVEIVRGSHQSDNLTGDQENNSIYGLDGDDTLLGGAGTDHLYGGSGSDVFKFSALEDMSVGEGARDIIFDFDSGTDVTSNDLIDLTGVVGEEFTFLNEAAFSSDGTIPQVRVERSAASSLVQIDLDNDAQADAEIELSGNDGAGLNQDDFIVG